MSATGEHFTPADWPADCLCSHGYYEHNIETRAKPCSLLSCGCTKYRPEET